MQLYGRYDIMGNTILRISDMCTAFQDEGIAIRFLNFNRDKDYNGIYHRTQLDKVISSINPKGKRRLGTVLRNKIVKLLIIQKGKKKSFKRPVLVTAITGGQVCNLVSLWSEGGVVVDKVSDIPVDNSWRSGWAKTYNTQLQEGTRQASNVLP